MARAGGRGDEPGGLALRGSGVRPSASRPLLEGFAGNRVSRNSGRGSCGCWLSGSTLPPMACACSCGPRGCRHWSRSSSHGRRRRRKDGAEGAGKNWQFNGSTIIVRAPITWKRPGGRKVIIAPDGGDAWGPAKPRPEETLIRALARGEADAGGGEVSIGGGDRRSGGRNSEVRQPAATANAVGAGHLRPFWMGGSRREWCWRN